jgi:uncharacterized protein (DUF885 family)
MTEVFRLCDEYITKLSALDPVAAGARGLNTEFAAATDYSPDGYAAQDELTTETLASLARAASAASADGGLSAAGSLSADSGFSAADRLAALHLRERLEAQHASHEAGEYLRSLSAPFGRISSIRDSVDLLARRDDDDWLNIAARMAAIPQMFVSWRASLDEGLRRGIPVARRQAIEAALQADMYVGTHDALAASYGDGPAAASLAEAAAIANAGYAEVAQYLRTDYAPHATDTEGVGAERYAIAARLSLGEDLDALDAYQWGWAELERIEAEMAAEAELVKPGATIAEATAILDGTEFVDGEDAYLAWLQDKHDEAISRLNGVFFDIAEPLRTIEAVLARGSASGAAYYTPPSEDFTRPGRTWWPLGGRDRFETWSELSTVFHEGVPGHHLQSGAAKMAGDRLSRFAKVTFVSGHGEGWALYAERLADELGWFDEPGTRLGMLAGSAIRAARVVIDIGVHLDLPMPDGSRWTFDKACDVLRDRGHAEPHRVHAEVVRYFGWPAQAISYKLGERAWLAARAEAQCQPGFDLKRWHTAALDLGPIGLGALAGELRAIRVSE